MKDKIIFLIVGALLGSIITTAGFLIYFKTIPNNESINNMQMENNNQMKPKINFGEEPPEKPDENFKAEP